MPSLVCTDHHKGLFITTGSPIFVVSSSCLYLNKAQLEEKKITMVLKIRFMYNEWIISYSNYIFSNSYLKFISNINWKLTKQINNRYQNSCAKWIQVTNWRPLRAGTVLSHKPNFSWKLIGFVSECWREISSPWKLQTEANTSRLYFHWLPFRIAISEMFLFKF